MVVLQQVTLLIRSITEESANRRLGREFLTLVIRDVDICAATEDPNVLMSGFLQVQSWNGETPSFALQGTLLVELLQQQRIANFVKRVPIE